MIPDEFQKIVSLTYLYVCVIGFLSMLHSTAIVYSSLDSNLDGFSSRNLSTNQIFGSIPEEFGHIRNLDTL